MWRSISLAVLAVSAAAADFPRGQIIDEVKCAADSSQSYALYLPSNYSPARSWSVILAFDPRARGRAPLVQYQAAAEKYGYIVAGSNNSRNGPVQPSLVAAQAMLRDVNERFKVDAKRVYTAGLSGGARFAMDLAMGTGKFAGVFASSAGFPGERRKSLSFPVFATAGTEDFNNLEMRQFDRILSSPHRVRIFEGGHTWLPSVLAMEGVEWMEIQAMQSGRRSKDEALVAKIFAARQAQASAETTDRGAYLALAAIAADFKGLKDVSSIEARAAKLERHKSVQDALQQDLEAEKDEAFTLRDLYDLENSLKEDDPNTRPGLLEQLRARLLEYSQQARAAMDSPERRKARRVVAAFLADNPGSSDLELKKLLDEIRPPRP